MIRDSVSCLLSEKKKQIVNRDSILDKSFLPLSYFTYFTAAQKFITAQRATLTTRDSHVDECFRRHVTRLSLNRVNHPRSDPTVNREPSVNRRP